MLFRFSLSIVLLLLVALTLFASDIEREPINYSKATPDNLISRLQEKLEAGKARLKYDPEHGYLKELLREFSIPLSSQVLVFSKTSLQRSHISPKTPRAIYFNDDIYLGYCMNGSVMEISVADSKLGTVFYTIDQEQQSKPVIKRQTDSCLVCHASSYNHGLPGHLVRSVYPDSTGEPLLASGSYRTDHTSAFAERWGGWYVSGTHGKQEHMGNQIFSKRKNESSGNQPASQNLNDLSRFFTASMYPSPHSDIVALMVLEHQTMVHNRITRALLETRMAQHYQDDLNKALQEKPGTVFDSTKRRIENLADELLKCMLLSDETKLTNPITGTTSFAKEFTENGPRDSKGRSLRDLDLQTRLFKYPCSYLIYSKSFDALPPAVLDVFYQKLFKVLTGKDQSPHFSQLSARDRQAILEILIQTKSSLPGYWNKR
ncbi:MAG: hypothetical protein JNJ77_10125 [Planctomycetia bacterium]|nr:hypothetical protein [Planctomycetia bacterium]